MNVLAYKINISITELIILYQGKVNISQLHILIQLAVVCDRMMGNSFMPDVCIHTFLASLHV